LVRQSIITLALLHEFVYEFIGNNTYIVLDRTALVRTLFEDGKKNQNYLQENLEKILYYTTQGYRDRYDIIDHGQEKNFYVFFS